MEGEDKILHGIDLPYDSSIRFSSGPEDSSEDNDDDDFNSQVSGTVSAGGSPKVSPTQHRTWPPTDELKDNIVPANHAAPQRRERKSVIMGLPTREGHDTAAAARHVQALHLEGASSRSLPATIEASFRDEEKADLHAIISEGVGKEEEETAPKESVEMSGGLARVSSSVAFSGIPEVDKPPSKRRMMMMKRQASSRRGIGGMM